MKKCPFCAEEIKDEAIKCKFCGSMIGTKIEEIIEEKPIESVKEEEKVVVIEKEVNLHPKLKEFNDFVVAHLSHRGWGLVKKEENRLEYQKHHIAGITLIVKINDNDELCVEGVDTGLEFYKEFEFFKQNGRIKGSWFDELVLDKGYFFIINNLIAFGFTIVSLVNILNIYNQSYLYSILLITCSILASVIILPLTNNYFQKLINKKINNFALFLIGLVVFGIGVSIANAYDSRIEVKIFANDQFTVQNKETDLTGVVVPQYAVLRLNGKLLKADSQTGKFKYRTSLNEGENNILIVASYKNKNQTKNVKIIRELTEEEKVKIEDDKRIKQEEEQKRIEEENKKKAEEAQKKLDEENRKKAEEEAKKHKVGDAVVVGDVAWKVFEVKDRGDVLNSSESRYPILSRSLRSSDGKFIEISMVVINNGKELKTINTNSFELVDSQGRKYKSKTEARDWIPTERELFIMDNLDPSLRRDIIVIYEIPKDASGLKLVVDNLVLWGNEKDEIWLGI